MIGMILEKVLVSLRDKLWGKCNRSKKAGSVHQIWSTNSEQRFQMRMYWRPSRSIVDFEDIQLIQIPPKLHKTAKRSIIKKRLKHLE